MQILKLVIGNAGQEGRIKQAVPGIQAVDDNERSTIDLSVWLDKGQGPAPGLARLLKLGDGNGLICLVEANPESIGIDHEPALLRPYFRHGMAGHVVKEHREPAGRVGLPRKKRRMPVGKAQVGEDFFQNPAAVITQAAAPQIELFRFAGLALSNPVPTRGTGVDGPLGPLDQGQLLGIGERRGNSRGDTG